MVTRQDFPAPAPHSVLSSPAGVHFEIVHEFDIPLDALELAVISPTLVDKLSPRLLKAGVERIAQKAHVFKSGVLDRTWHYQANVKLPAFAKGYITREMCAWDEESKYEIKPHAGTWTIVPNIKPEWRKYFSASGSYRIVPLGDGRAKRIVDGTLELRVPVVRQVAERMILNEVRKTFEAEAGVLRDMATLI
jgi:hypothetical protein